MKIAHWSGGVLRGYGGASTPMSPELDGRITVHQGHFANPLDHPKGPLDFLHSTARYLVSSIALLAFRRLLDYRLVLTFHGIEPGSGKRKVFYIPNALDSSEIHRLDNESFDVAGELGHFVFCGRLAPVKQVPQLIDAFATAIRQGGTRNLYLLTDGESALLFPVADTRALTDCLLKLDRHLKLYPG
jgi:glycosyltransferase involved in cell wall biosynthesis